MSLSSDGNKSIEMMDVYMNENPEETSQDFFADRYEVFWERNICQLNDRVNHYMSWQI